MRHKPSTMATPGFVTQYSTIARSCYCARQNPFQPGFRSARRGNPPSTERPTFWCSHLCPSTRDYYRQSSQRFGDFGPGRKLRGLHESGRVSPVIEPNDLSDRGHNANESLNFGMLHSVPLKLPSRVGMKLSSCCRTAASTFMG